MSHTSSAYAISVVYLVMRPYQKYRVQFRSAVCTMINSVWSRCREWLLSRSEGWRAYPVRRDQKSLAWAAQQNKGRERI